VNTIVWASDAGLRCAHMIDDILAGIFGEAVLGPLTRSRRFRLLARLFFGLLGAGLGVGGAFYFALRSGPTDNLAMHVSFVVLLLSLACFWFFNVALLRRWRWPGIVFVASLICLFLARLLFGP